jgi:hypothetical protein
MTIPIKTIIEEITNALNPHGFKMGDIIYEYYHFLGVEYKLRIIEFVGATTFKVELLGIIYGNRKQDLYSDDDIETDYINIRERDLKYSKTPTLGW